MKISKYNRGYTLVELLVALFIFSAVVVIGLSAVTTGFTSGNLTSETNKSLNQDLNMIMQTITQKMANANAQTDTFKIGDTDNKIYGFKFISSNLLVIASSSTDPSSPGAQCTFIGSANQALYMVQKTCGSFNPTDEFKEQTKISAASSKITSFELSGQNFDPASKTNPYLEVKISSQDPKNTVKSDVQTAYTLPFQIVQNF